MSFLTTHKKRSMAHPAGQTYAALRFAHYLGVNSMKIRTAMTGDAKEISELMTQVGYDASEQLVKKIGQFDGAPMDIGFVYITSLFHQEGSSGRTISLIFNETKRGIGIGRALVERAENLFKCSGCVKSEVTSGTRREQAHSLYESCGYKADECQYS